MSQFLARQVSKQLLSARTVAAQTACTYYKRERIGNREIVGFGINGEPGYMDLPHVPMQAIRFREIKGELVALKEKERGDWKKLSIDEKKTLYRASFYKTYAEINAPTGEWKLIVIGILSVTWISIWYYAWMVKYVFTGLPESFTEENQRAQVKRMIDMRMNPVEGLASTWDYEKNRWKD